MTSKDFQSIQYLGVEMYFEYLDNLNFLNNFSKKNDLEIFVKNHPTISIYRIIYKKDLKISFIQMNKFKKFFQKQV